MNEKTKRPWLQFRLSTAVLLMFACSGLIWANVALPFFSPGIDTTAIYLSVITLCGSYERHSRGHVKRTQVLAVVLGVIVVLLLVLWYGPFYIRANGV